MNNSNCDIIEQMRRALAESGSCVSIYMPMPSIPANALTCFNAIYDRHRAYMRPESQKGNWQDYFIDVELRIVDFPRRDANQDPERGVGVVISLCCGCGNGWSTIKTVTLNPKDNATHDIFNGHAPAAYFCWEDKSYTVYFF